MGDNYASLTSRENINHDTERLKVKTTWTPLTFQKTMMQASVLLSMH